MGSGQAIQKFVLGWRTPETQDVVPVYLLLQEASHSQMWWSLCSLGISEILLVPGTVLVARDTSNMSQLLSVDCAGAVTTLIFIDKTES